MYFKNNFKWSLTDLILFIECIKNANFLPAFRDKTGNTNFTRVPTFLKGWKMFGGTFNNPININTTSNNTQKNLLKKI